MTLPSPREPDNGNGCLPGRIILLGNYAPDAQYSMQLFSELMQGFLVAGNLSCTLLKPPARLGRKLTRTNGWRRWVTYIDKFLLWNVEHAIRRAAKGHPPANCLVHICDHSNAVYVPRLRKRWPVLVTCHDLMAIRAARESFGGQHISRTGKIYQKWISSSLGRAPEVVCVSANTRRDLARLHPHHAAAPVILSALNFPFAQRPETEVRAFQEKAGLRKPYLLHVGNNSWYKNRPFLLKLFAALAQMEETTGRALPELVLAGKAPDAHLGKALAESSEAGKVRLIVNPSTDELACLYAGAAAFVFPSLYEGFGWPPIEAQACGCPVVASAEGALAEVLGESALTASPTDPEGFAAQILRVLYEPGCANTLRSKGAANVQRFDRQKMSAAYLKLYAAVAQRFSHHHSRSKP
jgi:glycosyltransferase involved in cell wall biosynthesis